MSGHSKWDTIKRQKGANDAKRGAIFTRLGNAIALAARSGGDPDMNPTLALAVAKAKAANMPNQNIERSIKRGTGEGNDKPIEEIVFEGYGPGSVAVMVETATDNRNRTVADVRSTFTKNGGNLAENGAVAFLFSQKGLIRVAKTGDDEADELAIIDSGAEDVFEQDGAWTVYCARDAFNEVRGALKNSNLEVVEASLAFIPNSTQEIEDETVQNKVMKFMDALDELDDVVETYTNFEIA